MSHGMLTLRRSGEERTMSRRPIAFISSTVKDLTDVREHLKERLTDAGFDVRMSEDDGFPVEPGATSHDACLHVVRTADLFVLLVGRRYGGEYPGHNKSITWREWDEAIEAGLHPIVLVEECVNAWAQKCSKRREALLREAGAGRLSAVDARLAEEFGTTLSRARWGVGPDRRKRVPAAFARDLPRIQRFVDELRKGHEDNWAHMGWSGAKEHAWQIVSSRVGAAFAAYRQKWQELRLTQRRHAERLEALRRCAESLAVYAGGTPFSGADADALLGDLLNDRQALFEVPTNAHLSLTLHQRMGDELVRFAGARTKRRQPRAPPRRWALGEGHVGLCASSGQILLAPDLVHSDGWIALGETVEHDREHHRSAVAVPLCSPVRWTLTVTTSRVNHFARDDEPSVLTVYTIARMIQTLLQRGGS